MSTVPLSYMIASFRDFSDVGKDTGQVTEANVKTNHKVAIALVAGTAIGGAAVQGLYAQAKPPVYVVSEITVNNVDAYAKEYVPLAQAALKKSGGRLVVVSQAVPRRYPAWR
jgi:hypothetical protein